MVTLDGFIISHTQEVLEILDTEVVQKFVGPYNPYISLLNTDKPITIGPLDLQDYYFEHKRQQILGMNNARQHIVNIAKAFGDISGRYYSNIEQYCMDDAEYAIVVMGSTAGTAKVAVRNFREAGKKAGLVKIRVFRPFPEEDLRNALKGKKAVIVLDRAVSFGQAGGPVLTDVKAALFGENMIVKNYIYGLGGRDINVSQVESVLENAEQIVRRGSLDEPLGFIGLRE
jgi:pyruvate ferredoxin oxidoreductase alpha subunit